MNSSQAKVQVLEAEILWVAALDVVRTTLIALCSLAGHASVNMNEKILSLSKSRRSELSGVTDQIKLPPNYTRV